MKVCTKCQEVKAVEAFHKDKSRADGRFPHCKKCRQKEKRPPVFRAVEQVLSNYTVSETGCWEWAGTINRDGYGMACYQGERVRAHRLSLLTHLGLSDSEHLALHKCDNRRCINPHHLYLGTNADNAKDMIDRNRSAVPSGEKSVKAKLTESQAAAILGDSRTHTVIAKSYGIAPSTVSAIKARRHWKHLSV